MALPIPRELMTLDEWDALPEDNVAAGGGGERVIADEVLLVIEIIAPGS